MATEADKQAAERVIAKLGSHLPCPRRGSTNSKYTDCGTCHGCGEAWPCDASVTIEMIRRAIQR